MKNLPVAAVLFLLAVLIVAEPACASPTVVQTGLTINDPSKTWNGYTLYCMPGTVYVVDMNGNEVHTWNIPNSASNVKPLPNGHILIQVNDIPGCPALKELDWDGNEVWSFRTPPTFTSLWIDFTRRNNSNTLILTSKKRMLFDRIVLDFVILEVDPGGNIVWRWSTVGHFDQLGLSAKAKEMIANMTNLEDVFHCNSMQELPPNQLEATDSRFKAGNILVGQRDTSIVFIIDKTSGKIVWRMQRTLGQHHVSMIPPGLPGEGNIVAFDNGMDSGYPTMRRGYSRVLELDPTTMQAAWIYQAPSDALETFYSRYRGSCQRLPNGNTLITEAFFGRIFEVTPECEIVWEYVNPHTEKDGTAMVSTIFRAYRVDLNWPAGATGPWSFSPFPW